MRYMFSILTILQTPFLVYAQRWWGDQERCQSKINLEFFTHWPNTTMTPNRIVTNTTEFDLNAKIDKRILQKLVDIAGRNSSCFQSLKCPNSSSSKGIDCLDRILGSRSSGLVEIGWNNDLIICISRYAKCRNLTFQPIVTEVPPKTCKDICGSGYVTYVWSDIWSRVSQWLMPLFLLIGNVHIAPLGMGNAFCVVLHLFGDPIDTIGSLVTRLEVGARLYRMWMERQVVREGEFVSNQQYSIGVKARVRPRDEDEIGPLEVASTNPMSQEPVSKTDRTDFHTAEGRQPHVHVHDQTQTPIATDDHDTNTESSQSIIGPPYQIGLVFDHNSSTHGHTKAEGDSSQKYNFLEVTALELATICTAYDDLGHIFPYRAMVDCLTKFLRSCTLEEKILVEKALTAAATDLSQTWTHETLRVTLAVIMYALVVLNAFVKSIAPWDTGDGGNGGNGNKTMETIPFDPPTANCSVSDAHQLTILDKLFPTENDDFNNRTSHSIAYAVSYSWVIATILLSMAAGVFPDRHSVEKLLTRLRKAVPKLQLPEWDTEEEKSPVLAGATGMNYGYRPIKFFDTIGHHERGGAKIRRRQTQIIFLDAGSDDLSREREDEITARHKDHASTPYLRTFVAFVPLFAATCGAFFISYYTPTDGFSCRSLHQLLSMIFWMISHGVTVLIQQYSIPYAVEHGLVCIVIKDAIVAFTQLTWLILAFMGFYNRCICWSAWLSLGSRAHVTIMANDTIKGRLKKLWPGLTLAGMGFQFLFAVWIIWWKRRCRIFKRTKTEQMQTEEKMRRFQRLLSGNCSFCNN